ncbi:MAG: replication initiator protein [Microvirus sp.]|nr:MAG: replication initiator protein [Microvirus sp.]
MSQSVGESGKQAWVFSRSKKLLDPVRVPCGRCVGCKLERSRQWAVRILHHATTRELNCFITLTYDEKHLPLDGSLYKCHLQKFLKRLRQRVATDNPDVFMPIEYFGCGEYGDEGGRPHYHVIIMGIDFQDKKIYSRRNGIDLWTSDHLTQIWGKGFATIGNVTAESAAYCARYTMKKVYGSKAAKHYTTVDPATGEIHRRLGEFVLMSLKRPIGKSWLTSFKSDVYPSDFVVVGGKKQKPPRFYDQQLSETERASIKEIRKAFAKASPDNSQARLDRREEVKLAQIKQLKRELQ